MKDEIKEILDKLRKVVKDKELYIYSGEYKKDKNPARCLIINPYDVEKILNLITNLQEENKRLGQLLLDFQINIKLEKKRIPLKLIQNKTFMELYDMPTYEDYKSRIDKAIELLNSWEQNYNGLMKSNIIYIPEDKPSKIDLLNILKGSDDNE